MIKRILILLLFSVCIFSTTFAQSRGNAEETFKDANAYFYFEDYEEALALYLSIYDEFPNNANLDFRIGICYMNVAGSKHRAIEYLERASSNVSKRYSESSIRETRAPIEALFYLGNAYFTINMMDEALEVYEEFRTHIRRERQYDMDYFNHQVEAIKKSRVIQTYPVNFLRSNLGSTINNRFPNFNPIVSGDGKTLAFTTKERFYQAIMVLKKEGETWGRPRNITLDLVVDGNCSTLSLSYDGTELYLFKDDNHIGNIYVSNFVNGAWTPMRKLNETINTEFYETHASISADGKKLYFASNRAGGFGDLDLYVSERTQNGTWGSPKNLGANVNTRFNENTPFITNDGKTLFFSSDGHQGVGGYDIYFSNLQADGTWSKPINLGYPINTPDDDLFYQPIGDGAIGLMAVFDPNGFGEKDIAQIEIFLPKYQRGIVTSGDYFARKSNLPSRTLVVDTVIVPGVALIDPDRPEHKELLDSDKQFTLFFEGKAFDIKDQAKEVTAIAARLRQVQTAEEIKPVVLKENPVPIVIEEAEVNDLPTDSINLPKPDVDSIKTKITRQLAVVDAIVTDTIPSPRMLSTVEEQEQFEKGKVVLELLLTKLAAKTGIWEPINNFLEVWWSDTTLLGKKDFENISVFADSIDKTQEFIEVFAKLIDLVSTKSVEVKYKQSRRIAQTSYDEDFFFRLQRLKRSASPRLSELFDEAILTQPQIASFHSLWQYLADKKTIEFEPLQKEFLKLLFESSIASYFDLSEEEYEDLLKTVETKKNPYRIPILISIFFLILVIVFIYIRKRIL